MSDAPMSVPDCKVPKPEAKLVINAESWHFKYYKYIKQQWGFNPPKAQTSLCPYCQTMFWGSAALIIFGIFIIMGWIEIRLSRLLYKTLAHLGFKRTLAFFSFGASKVDAISKEMQDHFAVVAFLVSLLTLSGLAMTGVVIYIVCFVGWKIFLAIPYIPEFLWQVLLHAGWGLFYVLASVGWLLSKVGVLCTTIGGFFIWLFTNGALWIAIAMWAGIIIGTMIALAGSGFVVYKIFSSDTMKRFKTWALNTINGFQAARELAETAQREIEIAKRAAKKSKPAKTYKPNWFKRWLDSLFAKEIDVEGIRTRILGPLGIIWTYIKGMKRNVCPLVSFVNADGTPIEEPKPKDSYDDDDDDDDDDWS